MRVSYRGPVPPCGQYNDVSCSRSEQGVQLERISCDWPKCGKTFTRESDLNRHRNTIHQPKQNFWCLKPDCKRSEGFSGKKSPFSRKDKLDSHVKNIHHVPASSSISSAALAATAIDKGDASGIITRDQNVSSNHLMTRYMLMNEPN